MHNTNNIDNTESDTKFLWQGANYEHKLSFAILRKGINIGKKCKFQENIK